MGKLRPGVFEAKEGEEKEEKQVQLKVFLAARGVLEYLVNT